jgi:hypothetical protein
LANILKIQYLSENLNPTEASIQDGAQTGSSETCGGGPALSLSAVLPVAGNGISSTTTNLNFGYTRKQ